MDMKEIVTQYMRDVLKDPDMGLRGILDDDYWTVAMVAESDPLGDYPVAEMDDDAEDQDAEWDRVQALNEAWWTELAAAIIAKRTEMVRAMRDAAMRLAA